MFERIRAGIAGWIAPHGLTASASNEEILREMARANAEAGSVKGSGALAIAAYHRCLQLVAGPHATVPIHIKRRIDNNTREDAHDHPVAKLLSRRPNAWQSPSEYKRLLATHVLVDGNAYSLKVRSRGVYSALIPLSPSRMEPILKADGRLVYEYTRKDGTRITYDQEEIFHLRGLSLDGIKGLSVLEAARRNLEFAHTSTQHQHNLFKNKAAVSGIYRHPKELSEPAYKRLKAGLDKHSGVENTGESLILEDGMDFEQITMTSTDAQWLESRKDNRLEIYMHFGVSPILAGDTEKQTSFGTGVEQQVTGFKVFTMEERFVSFEDAVNRDLLDRKSDKEIYARFNRNAFVRGDIKTRYAAYKEGRQWGWLSADEIRQLEDMNPRPDGKGGEYAEPPNTAGNPASEKKDQDNDD